MVGNIYGGVVAAIIALPLAIAFGIASGLGPAAGLYGAIFLGFFASLFGGTKTQISGPTGPMTVVAVTVIAGLAPNLALVFATFFLAGAFQIAFGLLKFGQFVKYIPYPVISGFMNGIGMIIILLQINVALGFDVQSSTLKALFSLPQALVHIDYTSLILTTLTLMIVFYTPSKISAKFPATLIALIVLSLVAYIFSLDVAYVSDIPNSLPEFMLPSFSVDHISFMVTSALTLALLGTIDTLLTSLVADSITKDKHNSNKELVGQGIGNMIASLFGGLPGAGATMRTVVNIKNGATGRSSGMIHSVILLLILLVLSPLATAIPMPVLAGILIKVGFDILDYRMLKQLRIAPRNDLSVMAVVLFLTVFVDLIVAVFVGIILASMLIIQRLTQQTKVEISNDDIGEKYDDRVLAGGKIRIINIKGAFFFGSTSQIIDSVSEVFDVQNVVIDCSHISFMDLSAVYALSDSVAKLTSMQIGVAIVSDANRKRKLLKLGLGEFVKSEYIVESQYEAIILLRHENRETKINA